MWKWFRWVLLGIGIVLIGIGIVMYCYYIIWMKMSPAKVSIAEAALKKGIEVSDPRGDFVMMGTNKEEVMDKDKNNPSPYQVDYLDIKSAQIGADNDFIYVKVIFWDTIPKWPESINGDLLNNIGLKFHIVNAKNEDQIVMHFDFGWEPVVRFGALNTSYDYCPTGVEWPENARMACHGSDSKIYGGGGTNYVLAALPMKDIGLKPGQTIFLTVDEESRSKKYTHAAVDMLQGVGKMAGVITWGIGSSNHSIKNQSDGSGSNSAPNEIPRIPLQTCPDKEFEGQGDGALYLNGKKYYTESEDWDWIVANCPDYYIYR